MTFSVKSTFICTVAHNCHNDNKKNTVSANKENLRDKKVLLTYRKGLLPYKQNLLRYTKKDLLTNTKNPRQITTTNSHSKFLQQIATANSRRKFPWQILEYVMQKIVWGNPLYGELHT